MVHTGKHYKALIWEWQFHFLDTQHINNSFKTPIQPTTAKLNTANGLPMTALCMTAQHLRIADFKFTHNFVICDRLPENGNYFWNRISKEVLNIICLGQRKELLHTKGWQILNMYPKL